MARRLLTTLCVAWVALVLCGSLAPFDVVDGAEAVRARYDAAWRKWPFAQEVGLSRSDAVANLLLYVPLGFLVSLRVLSRWPRRRVRAAFGAVLVAALCSLVVETAQLFTPARVTSVLDWLLNTSGGLSGGLLALTALGSGLTARLERVRGDGWTGPPALVAIVLLMYVLADSLHPFHPVRSPAALLRDIEAATLSLSQGLTRHTTSYWLVSKVLLFATATFLLGLAGHRTGKRAWLRAAGVVAVFAVAAEVAKIGVAGRTSNVANAVTAIAGAAAAMVAGIGLRRFLPEPAAEPVTAPEDGDRSGAGSIPPDITTRRRRTAGRPLDLEGGPRPVLAAALLLAAVATAYFTIGWVLAQPGIPYNVRELFPGEHRRLSMLAFSILLMWTALTPAICTRLIRGRRWFAVVLPAMVILSAVVGYYMLRYAVTVDSLYDILGAPKLDIGWNRELLLRFTALYGALQLTWTVAGVLVAEVRESGWGRGLSFGGLVAVWAIPWLVLARFVVINRAVTDNLTELIRSDPYPGDALLLLLMLGLGLNAAALGDAVRSRRAARIAVMLAVTGLAVWPGWMILNGGLEPQVHKYGEVFPAVRFLLGPDRKTGLSDADLLRRWSVVQVGLVVLLSFGHFVGASLVGRWDRRPRDAAPVPRP